MKDGVALERNELKMLWIGRRVPKMRTSYNGKAWTEGSRIWILAMDDFHPLYYLG